MVLSSCWRCKCSLRLDYLRQAFILVEDIPENEINNKLIAAAKTHNLY